MTSNIGENLAREWASDSCRQELWDLVGLAESDPDSAVEEMNRLAQKGSILSMVFLGDAYLVGRWGVTKDPDLGEHWLRRSAAGGSIEGAYHLARHLLGRGDYEAALDEYRRLASYGFSPAAFVLGALHYKGEIVAKDVRKALEYFREAGRLGHLPSRHWISYILMNNDMGFISWLHGLAKRVSLVIPFVKTKVMYPESDCLRTW